jgi:hypothetical protein
MDATRQVSFDPPSEGHGSNDADTGGVLVTDVQGLTTQMTGEGGSQLDSREIEILFRAARDLRVWLGIDG